MSGGAADGPTPPARDLQAEQDHAEWRGWFEAQGYTDGNFEADSMAEAFAAGMQAARDLGDWFEVGDADAGTQPAPGPAAATADLGTAWRLLEEARARLRETAADNIRLRGVMKRLADEDTWVLDSGLGGGSAEELHVRASLAKQSLGQEILCCTECMVSLGTDPEGDGPAAAETAGTGRTAAQLAEGD